MEGAWGLDKCGVTTPAQDYLLQMSVYEREINSLFKTIIWWIFLLFATQLIQTRNWFRLIFIKHFWASECVTQHVGHFDRHYLGRQSEEIGFLITGGVASLSMARNGRVAKLGLKSTLTPWLLLLLLTAREKLGPREYLYEAGTTYPAGLRQMCSWPIWGSLWRNKPRKRAKPI